MLSVVIADDEIDIIELCKALITYPEAQVIGEAHNGLELMELIEKLHPDAVITDICMPGMTGLELIEKAQQQWPQVNFVVMSGYTDFQYVQSALRFGVWDYLLKPLKKTEVNRVLEKLDKHLHEQSEQVQQNARMQSDLRKSRDQLRERYVRDLWYNNRLLEPQNFEEEEKFAKPHAVIQCLAFSVDSNFPASFAEAPALTRQASGTIDRIRILLTENCRTAGFFVDWPHVAGLLIYEEADAAETSERLLREIRREIRIQNTRNNLVRLSGAASMLLPGEQEKAQYAIQQAKMALKWRLEKKQSEVILYNEQEEKDLQQAGRMLPARWESELQTAIEHLDTQLAEKIIHCIWSGWRAQQMPGARYYLLERMVNCLNASVDRLPDEKNGIEELLFPFDILSCGYGAEEIEHALCGWVENRLDVCRKAMQSKENRVILQAKEYVAQHYAEGIGLNDVAKHVCLSASYFSTLFKNETGSGFVEYVRHVRIEQAKRLLRESKMRIADIARKVGYHDMKFFNKVFYKETNVTPSEYRKFYT